MNEYDLLEAIGEAEEEQVRRAGAVKPRRWMRAAGAAACIALIGAAALLLPGLGGAGAGSEGGGHSGGEREPGSTPSYMSYEGPVLPLTSLSDTADIAAAREVCFDFSAGTVYSAAAVRDSYTLINSGAEDRTLTLLYPLVGTVREQEHWPTLTVDGAAAETTLYPGAYAGSYMGVLGSDEEELQNGSANLRAPQAFADFEALLADGSYQRAALEPLPQLTETVTVYRLSDYICPENAGENPTIQIQFTMDYDRTTVLTYGMSGARFDRETGLRGCSTSVKSHPNASPGNREPKDTYVILLGDDIGGYTLQGYRDGGCDRGDEVAGIDCTVTRYETELGTILRQLLRESYGAGSMEDSELFLGLVAQLLLTDGPLSAEGKDRYSDGMLGSIFSEARIYPRVLYFAFDVTVPAGGSVTVAAEMTKRASIDYIDYTDREGYDLAATLGSSLTFTEQRAAITHFDSVTLRDDTFGFDMAGGVTEVTLPQGQEHFWLEVTTTAG